ncbi:carbon storage regulator CsrA [Paenibacillus sp. HN-1]|uniref:carbon storage regulator CsrA n=1 Tax=Paenibacillus TaxID=44249 RepID=UPI001CA85B7E|nr:MULTISPECIES: carbon storage regulator CsrA [Paenibacillus]MBY9077607.1 carbon storage regulator CsrA [Paenibacillus sp. CGMCC 1.18879]MBY9087983.1 carbon storage regulator CsrA [Paenibacillus sinensis]
MLVLRRKIGESVIIGNDIQVQILGIEGDQIKLGFVAPKDVQVLRQELYQEIVAENMAAKEQTGQLQQEQILNLLKNYRSN